jgi:hypothetical protein
MCDNMWLFFFISNYNITMNNIEHFSMVAFSNTTKKACICSALSIFLILLFILSPLSHLFTMSLIMKVVCVFLLAYTVYLNFSQTMYLKNAYQLELTDPIRSQMYVNIICSYVFTLFMGLLIIYVLKSFF